MYLGLQSTSNPNHSQESYIHFPLPTNSISSLPSVTSFCDVNWGPQDASHPSTFARYQSQIHLWSPYFYGGVVQSYGRLTKRHALAEVHAKLKSRQLMKVSKMFKFFGMFSQTSNF